MIMNTKVLLAALAGGIATFFLGWALYGMALKGFFESNVGSATGVMRGDDDMQIWAIFAGNVAWSLLLALLYSRWAGITTFMAGATAGAWIGFLMALGYDLISFGTTNMGTLTAALVDPVVNAVLGAVGGGVVGFVLGYGKRA